MTWLKPETDDIRAALQVCAPQLAEEPIEFLAEGWSLWAFRAGDFVLRFPKREHDAAQFQQDRSLLPELAPHITTHLPAPEVYGESGPNGAPFAGHRFVAGISITEAVQRAGLEHESRPRLASTFAAEIGVFLRELHSFPSQRALDLGVPLEDGPTAHHERIEFYEDAIRRVFPLISCEARAYSESRFETFINEPRNFDFEPCLIHHDLDRQNTLIDATTGSLAGVIDWGDAVVGNPAIDLWLPLVDFTALGIGDQTPACLDAYGIDRLDRQRVQTQVDFTQFLWPFHDMLYGLNIEDADLVEVGIRALNDSLPSGLRC